MAYDPDNIFSKILRGAAPCIKVDETADALAIMDAMPQSDGHVLVIAKEQAIDIFDVSPAVLGKCMKMAQRIATAQRAALRPDGIVIKQLNGKAAGQTIAHIHIHVIPCWEGNPLRPHASIPSDNEKLENLAVRIREKLPA